jgi:hypothetical protein
MLNFVILNCGIGWRRNTVRNRKRTDKDDDNDDDDSDNDNNGRNQNGKRRTKVDTSEKGIARALWGKKHTSEDAIADK